jgi:hypothetical protein
MRPAEAPDLLTDTDRKALQHAVLLLESPNFAARLADYAGQPVDRMLRLIPKVASERLKGAVEAAMMNCLTLAIGSIAPGTRRRPAVRAAALLAGLSGGVSGFFGAAVLPVELPLTTALMLRAIADSARHHGEDLTRLEARLACLEVFALGGRASHGRMDLGYYASRALLGRLTGEATAVLLERGAASITAPAVRGLIAEIASRFSVVLGERIVASAVPVIGALGGAATNVVFMNHFQRVAEGHFTVRRLGRRYGADVVQRHYEELVPRSLPLAGRQEVPGQS